MPNKEKNIWIWIVGTFLLFNLILILLGYNKVFKLDELGQIGDSYAILNTFFSGLALAFIILTFRSQREELKLQREELAQQRAVQKKQREEFTEINQRENTLKTLELSTIKLFSLLLGINNLISNIESNIDLKDFSITNLYNIDAILYDLNFDHKINDEALDKAKKILDILPDISRVKKKSKDYFIVESFIDNEEVLDKYEGICFQNTSTDTKLYYFIEIKNIIKIKNFIKEKKFSGQEIASSLDLRSKLLEEYNHILSYIKTYESYIKTCEEYRKLLKKKKKEKFSWVELYEFKSLTKFYNAVKDNKEAYKTICDGKND